VIGIDRDRQWLWFYGIFSVYIGSFLLNLKVENLMNFVNKAIGKYCLDPRVDGFPLLSSPFPVLCIIAAYIYFVFKLGPNFMKHREPFKLNSAIIVFNAFQVAANLINGSVVCLFQYFHQIA
jgi:GNS1/SUR4 family